MKADIKHFLNYALKKYDANDYQDKDDFLIANKDIDKDLYNFFEYIIDKNLFYFNFIKIVFSQKEDGIHVLVATKFHSDLDYLGSIDENRNFVSKDFNLNINNMIDYMQSSKNGRFVINVKDDNFIKIDFNSFCDLDSYDIYERVDNVYLSIEVSKTKWTLNDIPKNKRIALLSNKKEILAYYSNERILLPLKKINKFNFEISHVEYSDFKDSILFKTKSIGHEVDKINNTISTLWDISYIMSSGNFSIKYYLGFERREDDKYSSKIFVDVDYGKLDIKIFLLAMKNNKENFAHSVFDLFIENMGKLLFESYGISDFSRNSDFDEIISIIDCVKY